MSLRKKKQKNNTYGVENPVRCSPYRKGFEQYIVFIFILNYIIDSLK